VLKKGIVLPTFACLLLNRFESLCLLSSSSTINLTKGESKKHEYVKLQILLLC
jgi:hypothetical protein